MKVQASSNFDNIETYDNFKRFITRFSQEVTQILNGNVSLTDNFAGQSISVSFAAPATNQTIAHTLGRLPIGYLLLRNSSGMVLYDGSVAAEVFTRSTVTLRATVAGTATILVF